MEVQKIKIKDLCLWSENARFPDKYFKQSESELINYFLSNKRDFKIEVLLEEIVTDFDFPQVEKMIVWIDDDGRNIVLEGNRRLACYKMLLNPHLVSIKNTQEKVIELGKNIHIDENYEIECVVGDDQSELMRYVERKHLKGNNEVDWQEQERNNHKVRLNKANAKVLFKVAIGKLIVELDIPEIHKEQILGKGYQTNLWRILDSEPSWVKYKFTVNDSGELSWDYEGFEDELIVIIYSILEWKGKNEESFSRKYNKNDQKREFLDSINSSEVENIKQHNKEEVVENLFGEKTNPPKNQRKTPKTQKKVEIFGRTLVLKKSRVNDFYRAICKIFDGYNDDENVLILIGMSLRLVLEISAHSILTEDELKGTKDSYIYKNFLKRARSEMSQSQINFTSLTKDWLAEEENIEGLLGKYAHGLIIPDKNSILQSSYIVADIVEFYFKK